VAADNKRIEDVLRLQGVVLFVDPTPGARLADEA